jgi:GntR family transcriptional regulator, rspAB operon transcriptional repressor
VSVNDRKFISAADLVAEELRSLIFRGIAAPGSRLVPDAIAAQFGLSTTPVRDALQVLSMEGLVDVQPRVGVFVRDPSEQEAADVYRLKEAIEPVAAALAAERSLAEERIELQSVQKGLSVAVRRGNVAAAEDAVDALHSGIFRMTHSEVLQDAYRVLSGRVRQLRFLNMAQAGRLGTTLEQHTEIVKAVVDGDAEGSARLMRSHILDAAQALRETMIARRANDPPSS